MNDAIDWLVSWDPRGNGRRDMRKQYVVQFRSIEPHGPFWDTREEALAERTRRRQMVGGHWEDYAVMERDVSEWRRIA